MSPRKTETAGGLVLAADRWRTNGEMIDAVAKLEWIHKTDRVLDLTYGEGVWWDTWQPNDGIVALPADADFRATGLQSRCADVIAFDPPYVAPGGRDTSTIAAFNARYGLTVTPKNPGALQRGLINPGLDECKRLAPRIVIAKCMDYVSGGHLWLGSHHTVAYALSIGFRVCDKLERVSDSTMPQPGDRTRKCPACRREALVIDSCVTCDATGRVATRQQHARRNITTMWVLTLPRAARPRQ